MWLMSHPLIWSGCQSSITFLISKPSHRLVPISVNKVWHNGDVTKVLQNRSCLLTWQFVFHSRSYLKATHVEMQAIQQFMCSIREWVGFTRSELELYSWRDISGWMVHCLHVLTRPFSDFCHLLVQSGLDIGFISLTCLSTHQLVTQRFIFLHCPMQSYPYHPVLSKFNIQFVNLSYLESQWIFANQWAFLPLEETLPSLSGLEAELWACLLVAQASLELNIMPYNTLKSQYYMVFNHSTGMVK